MHMLLLRHQHKRLAALEMELAAARHDGFVGHYSSETNGTYSRKKLLLVIGVTTGFERKHHRDAVRKSWLPTGGVQFSFLLPVTIYERIIVFKQWIGRQCLIISDVLQVLS